ncbi:TSUP family transporter [Kitasatospora saccharophila]
MNLDLCPLPVTAGPATDSDTGSATGAALRAPVPARRAALAGAGLGAATGVLGVGGGFLAVPALVSFLRFPMAEAIATSLLVITLNSLAALLPRLGASAEIPWSTVGPFAAAAVLGAWDGKRLAAKLSGRTLQRLFAGALLAVAALMLVDAVL